MIQRATEQAKRKPRRGAMRWLFVAIASAACVFAVGHFAELEHFVALARQARPQWLLLAILLQLATYASVAAGWGAVLRRAGSPQPLRRLFPIAIAKLFADQALPGAGLGGNVLLIDRLIALGTPRGTAVAALLVSMTGYYLAYAVLALMMLFTLWLHQKATALLAGFVTAFLLIAIAIPSLALWLRHRGSQPLPPRMEQLGPVRKLLAIVGEAPRALVSDRRLIAQVTLCNAAVFLADAATLAICLLSLGLPFLPGTAFLALMAGSIAATLAPIPLGLGSFEASTTAMLGMLGIPFAAALTATLLLRGLTLWLPLVPALVMMRRRKRNGGGGGR